MSFYLAKDMWERRIFETWMDAIVDPVSGRFGYYKEYSSDVYIYVINEFDMPIYRIRLEESYPKQVSEIELSNEGGSEIARQAITLSYRRYVPTIITHGGASSEEFLYDIPAVRDFDDSAGSLLNDLGILGGRYGNPLNFSQLFEKWADAGAVVERKITKFNLGGLGDWL